MGHISFVGKLDGETLKGGAPALTPGSAGLRWRMSATVFACNDDGLGDCSVGLVACRLNDLFKVVFPIASGRWR